MSPAAAARPFLNPSHFTPPSPLSRSRAPRSMSPDPASTSMSPEPADSENAMRKKPRLGDSSQEEPDCATGKKINGFEELGLLGEAGGGSVSQESDGKLEGGEEGKEELGFDLNFPASEVGKEGGAQLGQKCTVIDLEAESECGEEREELGFGYGGNGDLGFGLGDVKGETFGEGVKKRCFGREDKGKEKVGDGDWLQLCTGAMLPASGTSGNNSGDRRSDSLSLGRN